LRDGWKMAEGQAGRDLRVVLSFRVGVDPERTAELSVEEYHPQEVELPTNQSEPMTQVVFLSQQGRMTPAMQLFSTASSIKRTR